jgi:hypothetical protein
MKGSASEAAPVCPPHSSLGASAAPAAAAALSPRQHVRNPAVPARARRPQPVQCPQRPPRGRSRIPPQGAPVPPAIYSSPVALVQHKRSSARKRIRPAAPQAAAVRAPLSCIPSTCFQSRLATAQPLTCFRFTYCHVLNLLLCYKRSLFLQHVATPRVVS